MADAAYNDPCVVEIRLMFRCAVGACKLAERTARPGSVNLDIKYATS